MKLIGSIWNWIPTDLKKFVGYGIAAGLACCMVMLLFLFWGTGLIQEKLGIPRTGLTDADVKEAVTSHSEEEMAAVVQFTAGRMIREAIAANNAMNDSLFNELNEKALMPGVRKLNSVADQVKNLSALLVANNVLLQEQVDATAATTGRVEHLSRQLSGGDADDFRQEILELLREQGEAIKELQRAPERRITKPRLP